MTAFPTPDELGRRLAAARGYNRETAETFAKRVKTHRTTLPKWEKGSIPERSQAGIVRDYMEATGLPEEFFVIDLSKLPEMHAAWRQVRARSSTPEDLARELEQDEAEILPPGPNAPQTGEQEP